MRDSVGLKELSQCYKFTPIVSVEGTNLCLEEVFDKVFESNNGFFCLGFLLKGKRP